MAILTQEGEGLWTVNRPFNFKGMLELGHRMTVMRGRGGLVLHSPVALTPDLREELETLGPVSGVVVPNLMHDLYLEPYQAVYPQARWLVPEGFARSHVGFRCDALLTHNALEELIDDVDVIPIDGMPRLNESALVHHPSGSCVVADVVINANQPQRMLGKVIARLDGLGRGPVCARLVKFLTRDREACRASIRELLERPFDRLVVGHGDNVETKGHATFRDSYAWLLG